LDPFVRELREQRPPPPRPPFDAGASRGDDGDMEPRLRAIEDRLLTFETKLDRFATRDDVRAVEASVSRIEAGFHRDLHAQTWKIIGVVTMLFSGALALAQLAHF
jgi:hypothetical protein